MLLTLDEENDYIMHTHKHKALSITSSVYFSCARSLFLSPAIAVHSLKH